MFAASVFDHVLDSEHWHFFENLGIEFHLPYPLTKYKVLLVVAALIILAIFLPLARRARTGDAPRGIFWNFFEAILTFIRDNIAKPYIGHHDDHANVRTWPRRAQGRGCPPRPCRGQARPFARSARAARDAISITASPRMLPAPSLRPPWGPPLSITQLQ